MPGTINIVVMANRPLTSAAMVEAVQIAAEARTLAVLEAGIKSVRSGAPATGTGTDCIAIAAPARAASRGVRAERYCGKHTLLGELIGRAVLESCARAIAAHPLSRARKCQADSIFRRRRSRRRSRSTWRSAIRRGCRIRCG